MSPKTFIQFLSGAIFFLLALVFLIINASERAKVNQRSDDIYNMGDLSAAASLILSNLRAAPLLNVRVINATETCLGTVPILYTWESIPIYCQCSDYVIRDVCSRYSVCRNRTGRKISMDVWREKRI